MYALQQWDLNPNGMERVTISYEIPTRDGLVLNMDMNHIFTFKASE